MRQVAAGRLHGIELLGSLGAEEFRRLEERCTWRRYEAGEPIFDRDSPSRGVLFVVEGAVSVINSSPSGREIAYATVYAGQYFGELSAIDGKSRSATVVALKPCLLAEVAARVFVELLLAHPEIAMIVLQRLADIIRICDDRIMDVTTMGANQRVYLELLREAKPNPAADDAWTIHPMPTHAQIASRASTTRETVARVLNRLVKDGLVRRKGKTLHINDRNQLAALTEKLAVADDGVVR